MSLSKTCAITNQKFIITDEEKKVYEKNGFPLPEMCFDERIKQKMLFRNEWNFFQRKCDGTGKKMIAMYPPNTPFPVYNQQYWWGDDWDAREYGQDFDFNRPFFEQFQELLQKVPRLCIVNAKSENSQYTNYSHANKNCYMSVGLGFSEDCLYCFRMFYSKNNIDCAFMLHCEWCYECSECEHLYECTFCHQCTKSNNLEYCFDCKNCHDCFGCFNLNYKSHCIFNEQYSPEEYKKKVSSMRGVDREKGLNHVRSKALFRGSKLINCQDCTGDNVLNSKNCHSAFLKK